MILKDHSPIGVAGLAFRSKSEKKRSKIKDILGPDASIKSIANSDPQVFSDDDINFKNLKQQYYKETKHTSQVRK